MNPTVAHKRTTAARGAGIPRGVAARALVRANHAGVHPLQRLVRQRSWELPQVRAAGPDDEVEHVSDGIIFIGLDRSSRPRGSAIGDAQHRLWYTLPTSIHVALADATERAVSRIHDDRGEAEVRPEPAQLAAPIDRDAG